MAELPFVDSRVAFFNGEFVPVEEAHVSAFDRGFLYGDGIYETLGMRGPDLPSDEHLDHLYRSASLIRLDLPSRRATWKENVLETARRNGDDDAYVRILVSRGVGFPSIDVRAVSHGPTS